MYKYFYQSPIGILEITEEKGCITGVCLLSKQAIILREDMAGSLTPVLSEACQQLAEYFTGKRKAFELPIAYPCGTPFQHSVWNALRNIPYGETRSYEDIARAIGNPKAVRAIGQANTHNPILLLVPCHRVINKNGTIGGFGCGVEVKRKLLELEGAYVK